MDDERPRYKIQPAIRAGLNDESFYELAVRLQIDALHIRCDLLEDYEGGMTTLWLFNQRELEELIDVLENTTSPRMRVLREQWQVTLASNALAKDEPDEDKTVG